jgi:apolipoprotein N-acyltransferase
MRHSPLYAFALGLISALALPPLYFVPALWLAVPGLLWLIGRAASWRQAAWIGFAFGFGHHLIGLYWITEPILLEAAQFWWLVPFAAPGLAIILALFILVPCLAAWKAAPGLPRLLVFAGTWGLADFLRQFVVTGFPWNPWGADWAIPGPIGTVFLQPAAWIGVLGLTILTLIASSLPVLGRRGVAASLALLLLWAGAGALRLSILQPLPQPQQPLVAIIQGNAATGQVLDQAEAVTLFRRYLALTEQALARTNGKRPVAVLWPESASPFFLGSDAGARAAIAETVGPGVTVLAGTIRLGDGQRYYNSLAAVDGAGPLEAIYDKWHLVPFGEYQPAWMPIQILPGQGFSHGIGPRTLHLLGLPPVGPLICYESIFSGQIIVERDRPAWMALVTNDGWFGNSSGPRQHLAEARLRAVEEGLPLARAANTGISAVFDSYGRELGRLGIGRTGVLVRALPPPLPPTLFARGGLTVPLIFAVMTLFLGVISSLRILSKNVTV